MQLSSTAPVTILATRTDRRYIPQVAVLPGGVLRLNIGVGPDASFTPGVAYHSYDDGRTWQEAPTPVPRIECCTTLSNGHYYEIDDYFFQDPDSPDDYRGWAGFSADGRAFHREVITIRAPSVEPVTLRTMRMMGQPHEPWFEMVNHANHHRPVSLDSVMIGGVHMTGIQELESPEHLLGVGYFRGLRGYENRGVLLLESTDGGRLWVERSVAMYIPDTPEGANEAALVQLADGQLYCMARTGALMHHAWSADGGDTWSTPEPVRMADTGIYVTGVMPTVRRMRGGGLIAVYGRPKSLATTDLAAAQAHDYVAEHYGVCGKFVMVDPSGTGRQWQSRLDLHEVETACQAYMGVPPEQRLRVDHDTNVRTVNSWEYLSLNEIADDTFLITYDVQRYRESWNAHPIQGVRMLRLTVQRG